jgi:hypothetical protein
VSTTTIAMGSFYDEKRATSELRKYREQGPIPSTRALIEALKAEGRRRNAPGYRRWDRRHPARAPRRRRYPRDLCRRLRCLPRRGARGGPAPRPRRSRHLSARRLRRPGRLGRSCRDRHTRSSHQRLSGLGMACRTCGRTRQAAVRSGLSARHPRGEAHHHRHESDAPFTKKAGARVLPFRRCDRADRPRERSDTSCRA